MEREFSERDLRELGYTMLGWVVLVSGYSRNCWSISH